MDPLSDVLTLVNIRSAFSSRFVAAGRWALRFESYRHIKVGAIVAGDCLLTADGASSLRLSEGDCYLLTGGRPYEVGSGPGIEPRDGHAVFRASPTPGNVRYGTADPDAERTVIVGGSITLDDVTAALLLDCLPPAVRIPSGSPRAQNLRPVLGMLEDETAAGPMGAGVMIEHLTRILFVQALRAYLAAGEPVPGWLGALNDPQIGAALTLMHQQAVRRWTVAELAAEVGMSRSGFASRFRTLVGVPPLEYLLRWRMRSAAETLRTSGRTVGSVAAEWGYTSESAFSHAFKRVIGVPPGRHRVTPPPPPAAPVVMR